MQARSPRFIAVALASGVALFAAAGSAQARDNVHFSVGFNTPGVSVGVGNGYYAQPGYVVPAPVYHAPPAYYAPQPVYAPRPVYAPQPIYYAPPPVYVAPRPYYGHRPHRHGYGHGWRY